MPLTTLLGAMTMIKGQKVFIKNVHLHGGETNNHPFMTGLISRHDKMVGSEYSR